MIAPSNLRSTLIALAGAVLYYAMLGVVYSRAPYAYIPEWFRDQPALRATVAGSWFSLLNIGGALLAAVPIALGLMLFKTRINSSMALVIGTLAALWLSVTAVLEYGLPKYPAAWLITGIQILAVSMAVAAVLRLFHAKPANPALQRTRSAVSASSPRAEEQSARVSPGAHSSGAAERERYREACDELL